MIDKAFWAKVAEEWKKNDDVIHIPTVDIGDAGVIDTDEEPFGDLNDLDFDDILADFDI